MKAFKTLFICVFTLSQATMVYAQVEFKHEIGINVGRGFAYSCFESSKPKHLSQLLTPLTYKYHFSEKEAMRFDLRVLFADKTEGNGCVLNCLEIDQAKDIKVHVGYQRDLMTTRLRPYTFVDLTYTEFDRLKFNEWDSRSGTRTFDEQVDGLGFGLNFGLGLRYAVSDKWSLSYEPSLQVLRYNITGHSLFTDYGGNASNSEYQFFGKSVELQPYGVYVFAISRKF